MVNEEFIKENESYLTGLYRSKDSKLTKEDLQDLVQDTFEKVTLYQDYFRNSFDIKCKIPEERRLKTWLKFISVQVYDRHRRGALLIDEIVQDYTKDDLLEPHSSYFYAANKEEIDTLINLLPTKQRDIVYLKLILGHTAKEVASKINSSDNAVNVVFSRGITNLKKLINSDDPTKEVMEESRPLKPYGDKPYAGNWVWRYGESEAQRNGKPYVYTNEELVAFCTSRNLNYNLKERTI